MNKKELTAQVAQKTGLTNALAAKTIDVVLGTIRANLEQSEPTILQGFGSFIVKERKERQGFNPATKQPTTIAARKVVKFTASKVIDIK